MRTHRAIIEDAGGQTVVGRLLGVDGNTVKQWKRSDSIPGPYWREFARHGLATLEELAEAAAERRVSRSEAQVAA